jgi:ParB family transcriptional regulator, chromosome partitioning protein
MAKATKKQALGRGLSALLKDPENDINNIEDKNADKVIGNIIELDLNSIEVNPFQPRTQFNEEALEELSISIKELGIIQPITVRKLGFNKFQLVSGERRLRACKALNLETIPAYIRIANDNESLEMALVENIQRRDLDAIEIALSYDRLMQEINLTQEQLSSRVGKKRSTISNYLRLLKLDPIIQTGIRDGFISMGHGRAIINIENQFDQLDIYEKIIDKKLSVRETENLVKNYNLNKEDENSIDKIAKTPEYIQKGTKIFTKYFGKKVSVKINSKGKGSISIPFSSEDEFQDLKNLINK